MNDKTKILVVDDEAFNLDILKTYLEAEGFMVIDADDGDTALAKIKEHPDLDVIILDRMMPRMNGMEVLSYIKQDAVLKNIPVIMQTAAAASEQLLEGIKAGVYYYLAKPYDQNLLITIVKAALNDSASRREVQREVQNHRHVIGLMESGHFRFRTLEEAKNLAYFIANCFPDPNVVVYGLSELMINAVEHGNLGISYAEKSELLFEGTWHAEVARRMLLPENMNKFVSLHFESSAKEITVRIKDQGQGFDWQKYMEVTPNRAIDPNGRGIATSKLVSFTSLEYIGNGNEVLCKVALQ